MHRKLSCITNVFGAALSIVLWTARYATGCSSVIEIAVNASAGPDSLTSHDDYDRGWFYPNNYERCWRLVPPEDHNLVVWTESNIYLQAHIYECSHDVLNITCGYYGWDGRIGVFCGGGLIPRKYSGGATLFLEFKTNDVNNDRGFRLFYQAVVTDDRRSDCTLPADDPSEETREISDYSSAFGSTEEDSSGIVIGSVFLVIFVIGVVISVIATCARRKASMAATSTYCDRMGPPTEHGHDSHLHSNRNVSALSLATQQRALADAPPSYDEVMATPVTAGGGDVTAPPAYNNVTFTNDNEPGEQPS